MLCGVRLANNDHSELTIINALLAQGLGAPSRSVCGTGGDLYVVYVAYCSVRPAKLRTWGGNVKFPYRSRVLFGVGVPFVAFGIVLLAIQNWPQPVRIAEKYYSQVIVVIGLGCIVSELYLRSADKNKKKWPSIHATHEGDSKDFYIRTQDRLKNERKELDLERLGLELDARLKLEDFLIKFREGEHAKIKIWGTIFVSGLVSLIIALLIPLGKAIWHR